MQTFWLTATSVERRNTGSSGGDTNSDDIDAQQWGETDVLDGEQDKNTKSYLENKIGRLVDWNVEMLLSLIRQIM